MKTQQTDPAQPVANDALVRLDDVTGTVRVVRWRRSSREASAEVDDLHDAMYADGWICVKGTDFDADSKDFWVREYWKPNVKAHRQTGAQTINEATEL